MDIKRIACPSCGGSQFVHDAQGSPVCQFCGAQYSSARDEILCRVCGTLNPPQARRCMECGLALGRQCPTCAHINPPGASHCEVCANPLDTLSAVTSRASTTVEEGTGRRDEVLVASKQADVTYMAEQRARLLAEERERLARLAEQRARSGQEQRRIVSFVLAGVVLVVVAVLVVVIVASAGSVP